MKSSTLFVVATPIGNLDDMTLRALKVLKEVDRILCEDTRHTRLLLNHFGIQKPLLAVHDHNEKEIAAKIIDLLSEGESLALVSDAGTPLISDPGFFVVREVRRAGFKVEPIPGACAAIAALSVSGLPSDKFYFEGFLPAKSQARIARLTALGAWACTIMCYESTHRLLESLEDIAKTLPQRELVLAKELTKQFEAIVEGTAEEILAWLQEDSARSKGEFVLLIAGNPEAERQKGLDVNQVLGILEKELSVKQAASIAAALTGEKKNALYEILLKRKEDREHE